MRRIKAAGQSLLALPWPCVGGAFVRPKSHSASPTRRSIDILAKSASMDDGTFMLRGRGQAASSPEDAILTVIFKGKPTQHLLAKDDSGTMTVNKKPCGDAKTLSEVHERMGSHAASGTHLPPRLTAAALLHHRLRLLRFCGQSTPFGPWPWEHTFRQAQAVRPRSRRRARRQRQTAPPPASRPSQHRPHPRHSRPLPRPAPRLRRHRQRRRPRLPCRPYPTYTTVLAKSTPTVSALLCTLFLSACGGAICV